MKIIGNESMSISPLHPVCSARKPILASTQIAQVVSPYTKARGKYVATEQHALSQFLAQLLRPRLIGEDEVDGEDNRVVILLQTCHERKTWIKAIPPLYNHRN